MKKFKTLSGKEFPLPIFFPDATRAVVRSLDSVDIENTKTPGVLVNTYHLINELGKRVITKHHGIGKFMNWDGVIISDSGGFQVMSIVKNSKNGKVTDEGVTFYPSKNKKVLLTPEKSIEFQLALKTDLIVVLDDFTPPDAGREEAEETVERTVAWAARCKKEYDHRTEKMKRKPYLIAVVQGGTFQGLRKKCAEELTKIGFDGYGYGGWPVDQEGYFDYKSAKTIADNVPKNSILYGLGIGKPEEIVGCARLGYSVFDCVLPSRDARHQRLYVYKSKKIEDIDITKPDFYSFYTPNKQKYYHDTSPVSTACDCLLCTKYSKAYLAHLFRIGDMTAGRLATIHNLRFYSILMEKIREKL